MTPREMVISGAKELGLHLSVEQVNSLFIFLTELDKWNRKINLTAITEERDIIIKHVLDSLSYINGLVPVPGWRLLDMGSGAGFPAIPIKLAHPEVFVTLVESVKKKASFLRHIIRTLKLTEIEVRDIRTEELPEHYHAAYDAVTARAFANMNMAITAGLPFLKPGGLIVLSRGPEETMGAKQLEAANVTLERRIELTLPHSDYKRAIWVLKKKG
jgi:16S rRNA (guanine527-N7)-methyltransferase